jgi:hypothetical protein
MPPITAPTKAPIPIPQLCLESMPLPFLDVRHHPNVSSRDTPPVGKARALVSPGPTTPRCVLRGLCKVKRGPSEFPVQRSFRWPNPRLPHARPSWKRPLPRFVLPSGRRLLPPQSPRKVIRGPQRALRLGGRDPLALFQQLCGASRASALSCVK